VKAYVEPATQTSAAASVPVPAARPASAPASVAAR